MTDHPKIDAEFHGLIPPLTDEERGQLEANVVADGCREPLVLWRGILLDGHNRHEICSRLGIPFKTVDRELPDRDAAKDWIIRNQFGRRNLMPFQRAELALKLEPLIAAKAKENQSHGQTAPDIQRKEKETKREQRREVNRQKIDKTADPVRAGAKFATGGRCRLSIPSTSDWQCRRACPSIRTYATSFGRTCLAPCRWTPHLKATIGWARIGGSRSETETG